MEIAETHGTSHLVVVEEVGKVFLCKLGDMEEGVALALALLLLLGLFLFTNLNVILLGQPTKGFGIGEMLVLLEEGHNIASLAAAETFEDAFGRRDIKGGRLLVVEGTTTDVVGSALLERHEVTNHLLDTGGVHDALYGLLVNHEIRGAKIRFFFDMHNKKSTIPMNGALNVELQRG